MSIPEPQTEFPKISNHMKTVFAVIRVPRSWLPAVKEAVKPVGVTYKKDKKGKGGMAREVIDKKAYRARSGVIPIAKLEKVTGILKLEKRLHDPFPVQIIDGMGMDPGVIEKAADGRIPILWPLFVND